MGEVTKVSEIVWLAEFCEFTFTVRIRNIQFTQLWFSNPRAVQVHQDRSLMTAACVF